MTVIESRAFIQGFDLGFLAERYVDRYPDFAPQFDKISGELRRFLTLPTLCPGPLAAMSHSVDGLWHLFIEHTPQYRAFCDEAYGEYLDHQPRSTTYPVPVEAISGFYTEYPKHYGDVPAIWLDDIPVADRIAVARGEVPEAVRNLKWSGWPGWKD